jgi:hypothetical protein
MTLKLLDKRDVAQLKARERALEVSEGMKLAQRVDALRETQAEEEASLANFRMRTIEAINNETKALEDKKNILQLEVDALESRKVQALLPLTAKENALREQAKQLDEASDAMKSVEAVLRAERAALESDKAVVAGRERDIAQMQERTSTLLSGAAEIHDDNEARRVALNARERDITNQDKALESKKEKMEKLLEEREDNVVKAEEKLRKEQKKLEDDFRRLESREGTLERSITRLKK